MNAVSKTSQARKVEGKFISSEVWVMSHTCREFGSRGNVHELDCAFLFFLATSSAFAVSFF